MFRFTLKPQVRFSPVGYLNVLNGIASSVSHPRSVMALLTCQSPSQFGLNALIAPRWVLPALANEKFCVDPPVWPSPDTWPSYSMPSGLVPKTNAF